MFGKEDGIVVGEMPARAEDGKGKIGSGTPVAVYGHVISGDGGYGGDVEGRVGFVTNGNKFLMDKGVAVGRIEEGTRTGGGSTAREDVRDSAFKVPAGRILGHAARSVGKAGCDRAWSAPGG